MTVGAEESLRKNLKMKGVLTMNRKQKQSVHISKSSEQEPFLRAQLTPKGLSFDGQGVSAIRAVALIACVALIAIAVVAIVVLFTKSYQTGSPESEHRTAYPSQPLPENVMEETGINVFFEDRTNDPQAGST